MTEKEENGGWVVLEGKKFFFLKNLKWARNRTMTREGQPLSVQSYIHFADSPQ